ncbi:MAG: ABC transporter ATP-binding protein [Anaerolineales bacterium]|nr:ABC transporter ATP-binding protein [Anaerolineales bacterium]
MKRIFPPGAAGGGAGPSPLVEIRDLEVRRGARPVLQVDHLAIQPGEALAVIGPNGAGKSTFLLTLARLLPYASGAMWYAGRPFHDFGELDFRRRISLVLQEPLLLDVSVKDNVAAGLRFRRLPRRQVDGRVEAWLERLGVLHLKDRPARQLSGGEAQRVSLARAFALQPELLLLDEPFSSLDAPTRLRLLDDLQRLLEAHPITTVFITHDLDEALIMGDRVAVLLEGRLRQVGSPQEVFSSPADREVAAFVGVETVIPGKVIASQEGRVIVQAQGATLEAVGEAAAGRQVYLCLRPEDVTLWPQDGAPASSARNRLAGSIQRISPQGPLVRVVLDCGFPLVALITSASYRDMGLEEGQAVTATFKATAVHIISR